MSIARHCDTITDHVDLQSDYNIRSFPENKTAELAETKTMVSTNLTTPPPPPTHTHIGWGGWIGHGHII